VMCAVGNRAYGLWRDVRGWKPRLRYAEDSVAQAVPYLFRRG